MTDPMDGATTELNELSAGAAARRIARGELSATALVESCLARIAAREAVVGAWQYLDPDAALAEARARDRAAPRGPLHGVPVGIKDIFDTVDMPTEYGSPIYRGHRPEADAVSVARLRAAGAVVLGKTVTTEFAYSAPGKTANPHDPSHTPGGSSSGSAAAVADAMVPAALGTQTAGSVIRPSAFCGVVGFKPSHGLIDVAGVKALSPSLDTVGVLARTVEDVDLLGRILWGERFFAPELVSERPRRVGYCRTEHWTQAEPSIEAALDQVTLALRDAGVEVVDLALPEACHGLNAAQQTVMAFEARLSFAAEVRNHAELLSPRLSELIADGGRISVARYEAALKQAAAARIAFENLFAAVDLVLTPSAPGEAPRDLTTTGDAVFNRTWTLLHVPCIALPVMAGTCGLPVGAQLVGRFKRDHELLAQARWLEAELE
jgi:Asp-tRNA(Asn)/Glu-tRNA(Gln) amidotransferase A subunit family amidase